MSKTNKKSDKGPQAGCDDILPITNANKSILKKRKAKLRAGVKNLINTKTYKTYPAFIVEIYMEDQRRYLPLSLPNGKWCFENHEDRDTYLEALKAAVAN